MLRRRWVMIGLAPLSIASILLITSVDHAKAQTAPSAAEIAAYTGLHHAVARGDVGAVERLVAAGADLDLRDGNGRTPLMVATYAGNEELSRLLINHGAEVNALDSQRYDMLTIASVLDNVALVELAIDAGADAGLITSPYAGTALIAAAHLGHVEVVRVLIKHGAPLDHVNNLKWSALIEAIVLGNGGRQHQMVVHALIKAGADVNLADGEGSRPLQLARRYGYREIALILLRAGAEP